MKELFKKIKKVFFLIPLFYPFLVFARDYHLPFLPKPEKIDAGSLETFLQDLFKFGLGVAGFLAVVFLIWGSIEYMLYPSNLTQERKAKEKIWNAIFGLILILATYLILYISIQIWLKFVCQKKWKFLFLFLLLLLLNDKIKNGEKEKKFYCFNRLCLFFALFFILVFLAN